MFTKQNSPRTMQWISTLRQQRWTASIAIVGVATLASVSIFATGPNPQPAENVEKAWPISVTRATPQRVQPNFSAFGRIESSRVARLRSDLVAKIETVAVREGDWVETGDLLIQLDDADAELVVLERAASLAQHQANLASARSALSLEQQNTAHFRHKHQVAQSKLARHQDLMQKRLIAKSLLDEVSSQANQASIELQAHLRELADLPNRIAVHEADVARAKAQLARARLDVEKSSIVAPFAGPILAVHVAPGDHSNLSAIMLEIADASGFEVRVQVPDQYATLFQQSIGRLQNIAARSGQGHELQLSRLAGQVKPGQTGLDAFFSLNHSNQTLPPLGKMLDLDIALPEQGDVIALPLQAIYESDRIYTVDNSRLRGHTVERVGEWQSRDGEYQVLVRAPQIEPGTQIMTTQLPRAMPGLLVETTAAQVDSANPQSRQPDTQLKTKKS